jgi:hypothetical protein
MYFYSTLIFDVKVCILELILPKITRPNYILLNLGIFILVKARALARGFNLWKIYPTKKLGLVILPSIKIRI